MTMASNKIFVINLDSSIGRLQVCEQQLEGIEFQRISAVDGAQLDKVQQDRHFDRALNHQQYHKVLTCGEIGCYLSHRKVWQEIVDQQLDFGIVLEDDFETSLDVRNVSEVISQIQNEWHCIKLAEHPIKRKALLWQDIGDYRLITYNKVPARTCAQAISLAGAKHLLAATHKFGRPVDIDMQHWWGSNLHVFGLQPYPFKIGQNVLSDIDSIGLRKQTKNRRLFKWCQQIAFYFHNKKQTKLLLAKRK